MNQFQAHRDDQERRDYDSYQAGLKLSLKETWARHVARKRIRRLLAWLDDMKETD